MVGTDNILGTQYSEKVPTSVFSLLKTPTSGSILHLLKESFMTGHLTPSFHLTIVHCVQVHQSDGAGPGELAAGGPAAAAASQGLCCTIVYCTVL